MFTTKCLTVFVLYLQTVPETWWSAIWWEEMHRANSYVWLWLWHKSSRTITHSHPHHSILIDIARFVVHVTLCATVPPLPVWMNDQRSPARNIKKTRSKDLKNTQPILQSESHSKDILGETSMNLKFQHSIYVHLFSLFRVF